MAKRKLNVALIGYQFMGKAHSNAYRQVSRFFPELEYEPVLKVICGRNEARVRAAAEKYGFEEYATDWQQVVAREDIDLVDVSTPGNLHAPISIEAAKHGKIVLCEKPLANNLAEARAMVQAVEQNGVKHGVFFNYRKAPAVAYAKQLIDAGVIGRNLPLPRDLPAGLDCRPELPARVAAAEAHRWLRRARRPERAHHRPRAYARG
jgi:predicted dehydrogenase